eukprot:5848726-Amphidinium_carterae.1
MTGTDACLTLTPVSCSCQCLGCYIDTVSSSSTFATSFYLGGGLLWVGARSSADIIHCVFHKPLASKSPSSPMLDHWAKSDDGTAWIRMYSESRDVDHSIHDDCTLPFDSKLVEFVTVERDYVNGEHTSSVVPMTPIGNTPLSTMPWTGRT